MSLGNPESFCKEKKHSDKEARFKGKGHPNLSARVFDCDTATSEATTTLASPLRFTFKRPGKARRKKPTRRNCREKPAGEEGQSKNPP